MTDSPEPLEVMMLPDRYIPDDWSPEQACSSGSSAWIKIPGAR